MKRQVSQNAFLSKVCAIERRNTIDFKIVCDMRRKRINHVPRLTPLFFAALVMLCSPALPNDGQITLVVGFAAGGTSSTAARIFAESVEHITRTSMVVENRPGAGGAIAADWVLRQKGTQTLLFMSSTSSLKTLLRVDSCPSEFWRLSHTLLSHKKILPHILLNT